MKHKAFAIKGFKALEGEGEGIFEAIVAVFGNVDRIGEKVMPGAFTKSLARWEASGNPIPVIFSHNWDDLDAHIGEVLEAEEREKGLYIKGALDIDEDFAGKVWRKMNKGLLTQFSFAYDEERTKWVKGVHELRELELLEVGPTLVGINPETELIGVKELGSKPYPNEHACRLRAPGDFQPDSFRRISREHDGLEYAVILGRLKGEDTLTEQAYRYPIDDWEAAPARTHCADHDGTFEAAEPPKGKAGARHTKDEFGWIQELHDIAIKLGADCLEDEGASGGEGGGEGGGGKATSSPGSASTLAARTALELIELGFTD